MPQNRTSPVLDTAEVIQTMLRASRHTWGIRHAEETPERSSAARVLVRDHQQVCEFGPAYPILQPRFRAVLARTGRLMSGQKGRLFKAGEAGTIGICFSGKFESYSFIPDAPAGSKAYRISRGAFRRL